MKATPLGILTACLVGVLPFVTSRQLFYGAVNAKYFLIVGVVAAITVLAAMWFYQGRRTLTLRRPLLWVLVAGLLVYYLAALLGVFPEKSFFSDLQRSSGLIFLTYILLFAYVIGEFFSERDWTLVRRTIIISTAVFAVFTLYGGEGAGLKDRFLWTNLAINGFTFGNSTFAGTYLLLALGAALIELTRISRGSKWFLGLVASTVAIVLSPILVNIGLLLGKAPLMDVFSNPMLILGSARASSAAALSLLIFYAGYLLIRKYAPGAYARYVVGAWGGFWIVGMMAGLALLFTPGSVVQEKYIEASSAARIYIWEAGVEAIKEKPLFGWGPGNFDQAFQGHFNSELYLKKNFAEIWFDRAHNIIIDTLVEVGVVGAVASVVVVGGFVFTVYRARRRGLLGEKEVVLLYALPVAHFLQLQTGFDTVGSYVLLGMFAGYGLWLERATLAGSTQTHTNRPPPSHTLYYKVGAGAAVALVLISMKFTVLDEYLRQSSMYQLFVERDMSKQVPLAEEATSRLSSFESKRMLSTTFITNALRRISAGDLNKPTADLLLSVSRVYEARYYEYLEAQPNHYRAHMNLAYVLFLQTVLGENKMEEARRIIAEAYALSPNHPLTYGMDALAELYSGNLAGARKKAEEGVAQNPDVPFSKEVLAHIEKQVATFPTISVMPIEKL